MNPLSPLSSSKPFCLSLLAATLLWSVGSSFGQPADAAPSPPAPVPAPASDDPPPRSALIVPTPYMLIVSIDGLRPDCLLRADAPTLRGLMAQGSFSLWAKTTDVAITTPSHVSMLTGVIPETHGIHFNGDPPEGAVIAVPTIFDIARAHGLTTGLASGKRKFSLFSRTNSLDWNWVSSDGSGKDAEVSENAAKIILEHKPRMMFVHFPGADSVGHGRGWGTPEQIERIGQIDKALGEVLRAYDEAGLSGQRYVIISADHGGTVRSHGRDDLRSRFIPWICAGPGVRANYDLTRLGKTYDVATYDTFATACHILDLPLPAGIDGKPVTPIFEDFDLLNPATPAPATKPAGNDLAK